MTSQIIIQSVFCLLLSVLSSFAQSRFVTLTARTPGNNAPATNEFSIGACETAKLVAWPLGYRGISDLTVEKDGMVFSVFIPGYTTPVDFAEEHIFSGPAKVSLKTTSGPVFCTFEIFPSSFPPDKTVIVPPGTNQVAITLECSTNLVQWTAATNGVYGSPNEAKFFRIKADQVR